METVMKWLPALAKHSDPSKLLLGPFPEDKRIAIPE
jgi:hypothetical protein